MGLYVDIEKKLKDMTLRVKFDTGQTTGITGILGASGCGKSMTLKCIAGIVKPDRGKIVLNGRLLYDSGARIDQKVQKRRVGYLFQNYALFPGMTVRENVQIAVDGMAADKQRTCDFYLELLKIREIAGQYPSRLSGGQQQRVALARVLASDPDVLMLDEPFSALDAYLKEQLQIELLEVLKEYRGEVLMVTHSRDEIYRFCSQIHVLDQGKLVASGETKAVFADPQMTAAARLTGCKNIARIKWASESRLEVPAWGIVLDFKQEIPPWTEAIGIRAHYLQPVSSGAGENVVPCHWEKILEDPFEITGILGNGIWWKISKDDYRTVLQNRMPQYLKIPEAGILFLRDKNDEPQEDEIWNGKQIKRAK